MKPTSLSKYRPFPSISLPDRTWPEPDDHPRPHLVLGRPPRREPGAADNRCRSRRSSEFFELLVRIGFKQIEIGFPSAADTEFNFCRRLIEENRIPEDVTIQVLVQTRDHLIRRTLRSDRGARSAPSCTSTIRPRRCSAASPLATLRANRSARSPSMGRSSSRNSSRPFRRPKSSYSIRLSRFPIPNWISR